MLCGMDTYPLRGRREWGHGVLLPEVVGFQSPSVISQQFAGTPLLPRPQGAGVSNVPFPRNPPPPSSRPAPVGLEGGKQEGSDSLPWLWCVSCLCSSVSPWVWT